MSNFLAIATVTATLGELVNAAFVADYSGASVTTLRPDNDGNMPSPGVNIFLYGVTPNPAWRNTDLPTRDSGGGTVRRPRAAIDLHYLLSCYGNDANLEPQRVLGLVVRTLHMHPLLTRAEIRTTIGKTAFSYLAKSNLADDVDLVRFTPLGLNLEELSKLWSVYFQTSYRLSVAYQATVVLIESEESTHGALPVRSRNIYVVPISPTVIERVESIDGPDAIITAESKIVIRGRKLRGDITEVHVGESLAAIDEVSDTELTATLPAGLRAGVHGLQIVHPALMGTPPVPHRGTESNLAPFVLHPTIVSTSPGASEITVKIKPKTGERQRVTLFLNQFDVAAPRAYSFVAEAHADDTESLVFPTKNLKPGKYLARVQIDGADSPLKTDSDPNNPRYIEPLVEIT